MLSVFAALSLVQPSPVTDRTLNNEVTYVILADEAWRGRLERSLANVPGARAPNQREAESGMGYVGCVTTWRHNEAETASCVRARFPRGGVRPTVVLNTYGGDDPQGNRTISCIGPGGVGRTSLPAQALAADAERIRSCLTAASARDPGRPPGHVRVQFSDRFGAENVEQAKAIAASVFTVAIDHVGFPRGMAGSCLIQGRVAQSERGLPVTPGASIELSVPCGTASYTDDIRRVHMREMGRGMFARVYLSGLRNLLHIEPR